jgi:hypothetical protein
MANLGNFPDGAMANTAVNVKGVTSGSSSPNHTNTLVASPYFGAKAIFKDRHVSASTLNRCANSLAQAQTEADQVRLLSFIVEACQQKHPDYLPVVAHSSLVKLFVDVASGAYPIKTRQTEVHDAKSGSGRSQLYAKQVLVYFVPPRLLSNHRARLSKSLGGRSVLSRLDLLLIGKAGLLLDEEISAMIRRGKTESGCDVLLEGLRDSLDGAVGLDRVVRKFQTASPRRKAELGHVLGVIGGEKALAALAAGARDPATFNRADGATVYLCTKAIDALRLQFPGHSALYVSSPPTDSELDKAEAFCKKSFGIVYTRPRPKTINRIINFKDAIRNQE